MPNSQDPLNQLWLQQEVEKPDYKTLQTVWNKMRIKQRLYVCLDIFSVIFAFIIIWFNKDKLDDFTLGLMAVVLLLSASSALYFTWLRRFSLGWSNQNTAKYLQQLKKQIENNIKIATLSIHSVWVISVLMIILYGGLYYYDVFPADKLLKKVLIALAINSVMLPSLWIWAVKRKKRFSTELAELNHLLSGSKD